MGGIYATHASSLADQVLDRKTRTFLDRMSQTCAERDRLGEPVSREDLATPAVTCILGASIPKEHGGLGLNYAEWGQVLEQIGRICEDGSLALLLSMFPAVANAIFQSGNPTLIERYAKGILDGSTLVAFAYTEASDAFDFKTHIRKEGDHIVIDGEKAMITGGSIVDAFMTYVASEDGNGHDVVIIEARDEGVEIEPLWTMGLRSAGIARLRLHQVRVPADRLLVNDGDGLSHAQQFLYPRRAVLSAWSVGRLARTLNLCSDYVHNTIRYGRPLASYSAVRAAFGEMRLAYDSAKTMVDTSLQRLTATYDPRNPTSEDCTSAAKYRAVEAGLMITQKCFELMGGAAYCHPNPIERYVRDGLGSVSGAGAQDILRFNAGAHTLHETL